ncbi:LysR family transcriptional regulator [Acidiphilium multivorum]|uniref:LysR family transcriptional regulator n=1 Tax=Acidiphilium multivorum TaxID=62140 RepID=UPI0039C907F0
MDYLGALRLFGRAVELGSFSKAAEAQGAKVSTVSRAVAALEADLGVALFHRSTRRLHLTEPGEQFNAQVQAILRNLDEARDSVAAMQARPQGLLRLNLPGAFGRRHVVPFIPDFLKLYPGLRLELSFTDVRMDLLASGADLAIRIGPLIDSTLIARKLAGHRRVVCASPSYLAGAPPLAAPRDLLRHNALIYTLQPTDRWFFRRGTEAGEPEEEVPIAGILRSDDSEALLDAALAGVGIALLPVWLVGEDIARGRLVRLLPDWFSMISTRPGGIYGIYPPHARISPKVRAFLDFIETRFGRPPYWDAGTG